MNEWPEFNNHPNHRIDDCDEMEFVWLNEQQYNQARDAIAEVERLRALLQDAAEDVEHWGSYASGYFKDKWDLLGCIAKYRSALPTQPTGDV